MADQFIATTHKLNFRRARAATRQSRDAATQSGARHYSRLGVTEPRLTRGEFAFLRLAAREHRLSARGNSIIALSIIIRF